MTLGGGIVSVNCKDDEMNQAYEQLALQTAKVVQSSLVTYAPSTPGLDKLSELIITAEKTTLIEENEKCGTPTTSQDLQPEQVSSLLQAGGPSPMSSPQLVDESVQPDPTKRPITEVVNSEDPIPTTQLPPDNGHSIDFGSQAEYEQYQEKQRREAQDKQDAIDADATDGPSTG